MKPIALYRCLARLVCAVRNCEMHGNAESAARHRKRIEQLVREHMPSGGGFDASTKLLLGVSTPEKLVFETSFHHMNDAGYYDGWTEHRVTVKPSLMRGFLLTVTGRNRNDIKYRICAQFDHALFMEVSE